MKNTRSTLIIAVSALVLTVHAQSISDQLKAADCEFQIRKGSSEIKILKQMITLRAVSEPGVVSAKSINSTSTNTAGYRAYHLEFSYTGDHIDASSIKSVEFLADRKVIHEIIIDPDSRRMSGSERGKTGYFAINLENVPLLLLDDVTTIKLNR